MSTVFFGQYLLNQGIIDAQQLAKALTAQEVMNKKLGALAISQNLLNLKQVEKILKLQKTEDLFFGQCAQKLGYLTLEQVDALVKTQSETHVCLGEVLVNLGYLTKETRDEALSEFIKEENKRGKELPPFSHLEILKRERPFIEKFTVNTIKLLHRMSGIIVKFEKYETLENPIELPSFAAKVDHTGATEKCVLRYIFLLEKEIANIMHVKVCRRNSVDAQSIAPSESLLELLNIICCASSNSCKSLANICASVPKLLSGDSFTFEQDAKAIMVSLISPYGKIRFVLSFIWNN